jgi:hypothetical protein
MDAFLMAAPDMSHHVHMKQAKVSPPSLRTDAAHVQAVKKILNGPLQEMVPVPPAGRYICCTNGPNDCFPHARASQSQLAFAPAVLTFRVWLGLKYIAGAFFFVSPI